MAGVRSGKTVTTRDASTGEITGTTEYKYTTLSGKLVRVEYNMTVLDIVYDESGNPFSIRYKSNPTKEGVVYYYVLNVQGDVVGLLNSSGELVVEYKYDPWGKLLETKIGVDESNAKYATYNNMALRNPLRYRGYIYDRDTGLYYLQSRYYDPAIGRFINADVFASTGMLSLLSTNMFAYCENNPVNMSDETGHLPKWIEAAANWVNDKIVRPVEKFVAGITEDFKNFDINNTSEEKALESNYFSSYKGVPVIRVDGNRSASFGAIFLTRESNDRNNPEDVVRHEYGHTRQLRKLGVVKYAIDIGIPSAFEIGGGDYYSRPWEITADIYGGVQSRHHTEENIKAGFSYLERSKRSGPFIWVFMD